MNFKLLKKIALGASLLFSIQAQAQVQKSTGAWHTAVVKHHLNDKFFLKNEFHVRRAQFYANWQQFLLRPSINYKLTPKAILSSGYTYIINYSEVGRAIEHNVWEEIVLVNPIKQVKVSHRFRYEQRFTQTFTDDSFKHFNRLRYRITLSRDLFKINDEKSISATAFNELWLHTENGIQPTAINQNWVYFGLDYPLNSKTKVSIGYMNLNIPEAGANPRIKQDIIQLSLSATI